MKQIALLCALLTLAAPATATELFSAAGAWTGEGRIATSPDAPLERGRCRVQIAPDSSGRDVSITGQCAVAAGLSDISLRLVRGAAGRVNAGFWSAATGQTVQFAGTETEGTITLAATAPVTVDSISYETRVEVQAPEPGGFTLRQMIRTPGAEAWRLVVDMAYSPSDG